jgi:putative transposase
MLDIFTSVQGRCPSLQATTVGPLSRIIGALWAMSGRVTMVGIARWAGPGGSYRTVQRFFDPVMSWPVVFWVFLRPHGLEPTDTSVLAGDECVVTKAGKKTYGLDRFFSSVYGKPVPGLSFFAWSLMSLQERRSSPLRVEPMLRTEAEKAATHSKARRCIAQPTYTATQGRPGRPPGSKNRKKTPSVLSPEPPRIQTMIQQPLSVINGIIPLSDTGLDGHFGNHLAFHMVRSVGLPLLSQGRPDAALYFPYAGPYAGRGPRRTYGSTLDDPHIPVQYLKRTTMEANIQTHISQATMWHKEFVTPLHGVIMVKIKLQTQARAHVVFLSRDMV